MKYTLVFIIPVFALLFLIGRIPDDGLEQVGYFKSGDKGNRVFTYRMDHFIHGEELLDFARRIPHTNGRLTAAILYENGYTAPDVTVAKDYFTAFGMIDRHKGKRWEIIIGPKKDISVNGKPTGQKNTW